MQTAPKARLMGQVAHIEDRITAWFEPDSDRLFVYISPLVKQTQPAYQPVREAIEDMDGQLACPPVTVEDPSMGFGEATLYTYVPGPALQTEAA